MEKYKICPYCGEKNDPSFIDCFNCSTDLTGERITDDSEQELSEKPQTSNSKALVRICDCGTKNEPNARKCVSCGEDISDILPVEISTGDNSFIISSIDGKYAYQLFEKEVILGREGQLSEYLLNKQYVSRSHCRLFVNEDKLFVENLSKTNPTFVNNEKIVGVKELKDGDELGVGGMNINGKRQEQAAYFIVRIGNCI